MQKAKEKLSTPDQRMLDLMQWAVKSGLVTGEGDYWKKIGFLRNNISNLRQGIQRFTRDHIEEACKFTGASADWIFGLSKEMFREGTTKDPLTLLRQATAEIEAQLGVDGILSGKKGGSKIRNSKKRKIQK